MTLLFRPLTVADREAVQAVTLHAGRRNCNYTFANLVGWQFWFHTEVCVLADAVVLRFNLDGKRAYMVCKEGELTTMLIVALLYDSGGDLTLLGLENNQAETLSSLSTLHSPLYTFVDPRRNQYDYIYRRDDLAALQGGRLKAKRNHVNRFRAEHPDFEYRQLTPELFDECRRLTAIWREEKNENDNDNENQNVTIDAERRVMETVFSHWGALGMMGGCIFVDGRMVAFTYGAAVTTDTFDICVEKADRSVEGAFAIINQQFAEHLPEQYIYLNREEDMGIPGLRKAKLSYHPEILLSYNAVKVRGERVKVKAPEDECRANSFALPRCGSVDEVESETAVAGEDSLTFHLTRMTAEDAPLTVDWMVRQYGFDSAEVEDWVQNLHFNWPMSVKALDRSGNVIGLLNMSDYRIEEETLQILTDAPELLASLNARRYIAVFSFIVAQPWRGTRLNYDMLMSIMPELKVRYDFVFIPVLHRLKTHRYWQRWGATEFYRDAECVYYKLEMNKIGLPYE